MRSGSAVVNPNARGQMDRIYRINKINHAKGTKAAKGYPMEKDEELPAIPKGLCPSAQGCRVQRLPWVITKPFLQP